MVAEKGFVEKYAEADMDTKFNIIFRHFDNFLELVDMNEAELFEDIKAERLYNRRKEKGDPGIRVQRSGRSDPTCMEATGNVTLIQDIREGSIDDAMKYADEDMGHREDIETLRKMRSDYANVVKAIKYLPFPARTELRDVLTGKRSIMRIAEDTGCIYDSAKIRVYRNRRKVKDTAKCLIEEERKRSRKKKGMEGKTDAENGCAYRKPGGSCADRTEKIRELQGGNGPVFTGETYDRRAC